MSEPTADELWAWLTACTGCGQPHEFRRADPPRSGWTWVAPDGHGYDPRAPYALVRLRDTWNAEQALRSPERPAEADPAPTTPVATQERSDGVMQRQHGPR